MFFINQNMFQYVFEEVFNTFKKIVKKVKQVFGKCSQYIKIIYNMYEKSRYVLEKEDQ